ncbi:MAG: alginate lyase family protein, partial [Chloroflexota bacterium]
TFVLGGVMVQRIVLLSVLCTLLVSILISTGVQAHGQIRPEGIYIDNAEVEQIRERKDTEPWKSAYNDLIREARAALRDTSHSVIDNHGGNVYMTEPPYCGWKRVDGNEPDCRDGEINPQANRVDYENAIATGKNARALGLAYRLTGEDAYADKLVDVIDTWALHHYTYMEPRFSNDQSRIELSITLPGLFYGADLIRDYPGWSVAHQNQFFDWVDALMEAAENWRGTNNFELWRLVLLASGSALTDNEVVLVSTFERWRQVLPEHVGEDGQMVKELGRTKSLMYSLYALNALVQVAEIAEHQRVDLYTYEVAGRSLRLALDYHAPYAIDPSTWPYKQMSPIEAKDVAIYEVAYQQRHSAIYHAVIEAWGRPLYETRTMGPVTLTHGHVSVPPVDPEPTPPPPQDDLTLLVDEAHTTRNVRLRDCPAGEDGQCWAWISSGQWVQWDMQVEAGERAVCVRAARWSSGPGATFSIQVDEEEQARIRVQEPHQRFANHCTTVALHDGNTLRLRVVSGHSVDLHSIIVQAVHDS